MSAQPRRSRSDFFFETVVRILWMAAFPILAVLVATPAAHADTTTTLTLTQQGLPLASAAGPSVDGQPVALGQKVAVTTGTHSWTFQAMVTTSGALYITTTSAGTADVNGDRTITATYKTMEAVISDSVWNGTLSASKASVLKNSWNNVKGGVTGGNAYGARQAVRNFASQVRTLSPSDVTILSYAQAVYTALGGVGTV